MGSETLVQTHVGRADTTAGIRCPQVGRQPVLTPGLPEGCVCPSTRAGQGCRATATGSGSSHPFLSSAFHQGRWLSSRMKYSSPFCSCRSCAFIGS